MIRLELPYLPPTSNNAYENVPKKRLRSGQMVGGGRRLTTEGTKFLTETKTLIASKFTREMLFFKPNVPYLVVIRFFCPDIENKGWAQGKAENRYKKFDGGNLTKLLEDALKDVGGIDDSQTLRSFWEKVQGAPRTVLWVFNLEEEATPFDEPLRALS
jgi:hypothetical protein